MILQQGFYFVRVSMHGVSPSKSPPNRVLKFRILAMETWKTRLATIDDIEALQANIIASARKLNSEHYSKEQVESILKYVYGVDSQLIRDKTYFVVQDGDKNIGCGGWSRRKTLYG